jgi:hypothetical protein
MADARTASRPPGRKAAGKPRTAEAEAAEGRPSGPVCPVTFCPVGLILTAGGQARPEVIEHLLAAGQELLLAVKALIDARVEGGQRGEPLERITIE